MILVAAATAQELAFLEQHGDVATLVVGIGPVEAAARVAQALARARYDLVVNAGIAGAYDRAIPIGDGVVIADERIELDLENGTPLALPSGAVRTDRAESDPALVARLVAEGFRRVSGVTVMRVTASEATTQRLRALGAHVESMEGFGVLRAAQLAGVPAIELRGISNYAGDRALSQWSFTSGVEGLARVLNVLLCILSPIRPAQTTRTSSRR